MTEVVALDNKSIKTFLINIEALEVGPNEIGEFVRRIYTRSDLGLAERVFEALRTAVWHLLRFPERTKEDYLNWHTLLRRVAALYSSQQDVITEARIRVLSDLVLELHRHHDVHIDVPDSPPVQEILQLLEGYAFISCAEVSRLTGILPFNITLITNNMARAGLIKKQGYGPTALLSPIK